MHFNVQKFNSVFEQFILLQSLLWVKNAKNDFVLRKKNGFESSFIKWTLRWLQTGLSDLKKHQSIKILLMVDFLRIFKMLPFSKIFEIFEIHQYFLVKLLNAPNCI